MKKITIADEFIPRKLDDTHIDCSKFKLLIIKQIESKFSSEINTLERMWIHGNILNVTWLGLVARNGKLYSKTNGKYTVKYNIMKDIIDVFIRSWRDEINILDNAISRASKPLIVSYAKFREANFGESSHAMVQQLLLKHNIMTHADFVSRTNMFMLIPVLSDIAMNTIANLEQLSRVTWATTLATTCDTVPQYISPDNFDNLAKHSDYCLWSDFYMLKNLTHSTIDFQNSKDKHCRSMYQEYCVHECTNYHLTSQDINLLGIWLKKTREYIMRRVKTSHILRIVFVDGENCLGPNLDEMFETGEHSFEEIYIIFGRRYAFEGIHDSRLQLRVVVMPNLLKNKDAADVDFVREAIYLNEILPPDIDFLLLTGDHFVVGVIAAIRTKRNCLWSKRPNGINVDNWNTELKRIAELQTQHPWCLTMPSRVIDAVLKRNNEYCCCLDANGLPCCRLRFFSLVTCEKHI
jgi:hypothetical protein